MLALPSTASPSRDKSGKVNIHAERDRLMFYKQKQSNRGNDLTTKVYPSDVIPEQYIERKRDYRPNNFMGANYSQLQKGKNLPKA